MPKILGFSLACLLLAAPARGSEVEVRPGDTLGRVAERELGDIRRWREIAEANSLAEPYLLRPGQRLRLPDPPGAAAAPAESPPVESPREEPPPDESDTSIAPVIPESPARAAAEAAAPRRRVYGEDPVAEREIPLEALVAVAVEKNLPLLSGRLTPRISEAQVLSAVAAFDPTFEVAPTYTRRERDFFLAPPPTDERTQAYSTSLTGTLPTSTEYGLTISTTRTSNRNTGSTRRIAYAQSATFTLTQPLLRGAWSRIALAPVEIARLNSEAARARLARLAENTISQVENAYYSLAQAEATLESARESLARAEEVLRRNRERARLDLIPLVDLMTAEHNVSSRAAVFVNAARTRQDAAEALVFLVFGEGAIDRIRTDSSLVRTRHGLVVPPTLASPEAEVERALLLRRDVAAARRDVERTGVSLRVSENSLLPGLDLTGSLDPGGSATHYRWDFDHPGENTDDEWSAGVVFSIPIGNNAAQATHRQTILDAEQKRLALLSTQNAVRNEVRQAMRGVTAGLERLALAEEAENLTRRQYELAQKSLELGLVDTFRLLQHEEDLTQAQTATIQARFALETAITSYHFAMGTIADRYYTGGVIASLRAGE